MVMIKRQYAENRENSTYHVIEINSHKLANAIEHFCNGSDFELGEYEFDDNPILRYPFR